MVCGWFQFFCLSVRGRGVQFHKYFVLYIGYSITINLTFHIYKSVQSHIRTHVIDVCLIFGVGGEYFIFVLTVPHVMWHCTCVCLKTCAVSSVVHRNVGFWCLYYIVNTLGCSVLSPKRWISRPGGPATTAELQSPLRRLGLNSNEKGLFVDFFIHAYGSMSYELFTNGCGMWVHFGRFTNCSVCVCGGLRRTNETVYIVNI